jgi:very-short-patch-repair endonuclease
MKNIEFVDATLELKQYNEKAKSNKVLAEFWSNKATKNAILYLREKTSTSLLYEIRRGKGGGTLMHPELFVFFKNWLYKIPNKTFSRDEVEFVSVVQTTFFGVYDFVPQKNFGQYFVDLYCEELNLCIEYDEEHHDRHFIEDAKREEEIKKEFGVSFLRHKSKDNLFVFINRVIRHSRNKILK